MFQDLTGVIKKAYLYRKKFFKGVKMDQAGEFPFIFLIIALLAMFYFFLIRPQRKRQKEHSKLIEELKRGDKVITAGGIFGKIEVIDEKSVVLKVEGGTTLRVLKNSIVGKQSEY
jgi:preprotein translocase subunit YajC